VMQDVDLKRVFKVTAWLSVCLFLIFFMLY
jgi:hypothetical protein